MLMVSELSEAMEGARKSLKDDHLPQYDMFDVELIDCLIRMLDTMGERRRQNPSIDYDQILADKLQYNATRPDHKPEARKAAGGKKF